MSSIFGMSTMSRPLWRLVGRTTRVGARVAPRSSSRIQQQQQQQRQQQQRWYNFASSSYVDSFDCEPSISMDSIREGAVEYLDAFDQEHWFKDPVRTVLNGQEHYGGTEVDTLDAFNNVVGKQLYADKATVDAVIDHMHDYTPPLDLREQVRRVEKLLLSKHAPALIGNQAMDFHKQDGVTEIEESIFANIVEQKLNDLLFLDEIDQKVTISRRPALVGCVSNFSNFLDLCRKVLRNIELGVPVIVLSRSNTTQHMFRWFQILKAELEKEGVDLGMITYLSANVADQRRVMQAAEGSPLYFTGSREVAAAIKEIVPKTFASTGGPNTMVAAELNDNIKDAIRMSSLIENSGQCTAMRHLVAPKISEDDVEAIFSEVPEIDSAKHSLSEAQFGALFKGWGDSFHIQDGYQSTKSARVAYRVRQNSLPETIEENWRRVYLDVTSTDSAESIKDPKFLEQLANWLVKEQPITLAINGDSVKDGYPIATALFERTSQAVYSIGVFGSPCLTCQARPQDGEIFGEFPPRKELTKYTKFPVIVPSSTPGYNTTYNQRFLKMSSERKTEPQLKTHLFAESAEALGYINIISEYLEEACGPKTNTCARTVLWGLQRPPLGQPPVVLVLEEEQTVDDAGRYIFPFYATNAYCQLRVLVHPKFLDKHESWLKQIPNLKYTVYDGRHEDLSEAWSILRPDADFDYPLVGHFMSTIFPLGHIKSTDADDKAFLKHFSKSGKWLRRRDL